ncbi:MAG: DNA repair protein RecO [Chloroherpetonaceae bacterium]|nr:DNA repair protein RecO [Chthonomonadaceae bacterium]MDW8207881.1 DNA repair protein RecO [Chloroherpetonaceae bacterium]
MPAYTADAIVLRRIDLGEADRIVTLFTREYGKVAAIAKGARRPRSRFSGGTELFMVARFLLATGRNLDVVTQCEITRSFAGLRTDLNRLARATYLCELLDRLTPERDAVTAPELFDLTMEGLEWLDRAQEAFDVPVHAYELRLMEVLGYAPSLDACVLCGEPLQRFPVGFSPAQGGAVCTADRHRVEDAFALSREALHLLRVLAQSCSEEILDLRPDLKTAAEVARAMRRYIRFRTERDLQSAAFLEEVRAAQRVQIRSRQ